MIQVIYKFNHFLYEEGNNLTVRVGNKVRPEGRVPSLYDQSSKMFHKPFKHRIKSHLPFVGIIRSSPYSPR
jgi:hypothetical protein